jgi:hypothetical protein
MYLGYIRSVLEYCASTWYACLSTTNHEALQCLQNKALRIILGVPRCTQIEDLHLEANVLLLADRMAFLTTLQAKKYHHFVTEKGNKGE